MERMNQGDIFLCVNKNFGTSYDTMADLLSEILSSIDKFWLNRRANQHRPGDEILSYKHEEIYEKLFAPQLANKSQEEKENMIFNIKGWVREKNLTFNGINKINTPENG